MQTNLHFNKLHRVIYEDLSHNEIFFKSFGFIYRLKTVGKQTLSLNPPYHNTALYTFQILLPIPLPQI